MLLPQLRGGLFLTAVTVATWWPIVPPLLGSPSSSVPTNFYDGRWTRWAPQRLGGPSQVTLGWLSGVWNHTTCKVKMSPNQSSHWVNGIECTVWSTQQKILNIRILMYECLEIIWENSYHPGTLWAGRPASKAARIPMHVAIWIKLPYVPRTDGGDICHTPQC